MSHSAAQQLILDEAQARNEHQLELENLFDKHQLLPRVRQAFQQSKQVNFHAMMESSGVPEEFGWDVLAQIAIHKRCNVPTMLGCLRRHAPSVQETADLLELAVNAKLLTYSEKDQQLIVIYDISARLQAELDQFQYPLPMVVPPRVLHDNRDSGYLTGRGSVILRDNHHDDDICLDHLNRMNQTKLCLNLDTAQMIQNRWKGLDKKAPDETWDDFKRRQRAFEKYDKVAKNVIGILLQEGNEIYLTHKYDKRGRTYCMGFHVTYQGTDWNKAVIELAEKEHFTG